MNYRPFLIPLVIVFALGMFNNSHSAEFWAGAKIALSVTALYMAFVFAMSKLKK